MTTFRKKLLWKLWSYMERYFRPTTDSKAYIVTGFPRSGTSLVSSLVGECGVSFGDERYMKKSSDINPRGFFENKRFFSIIDTMLQQARLKKSYCVTELDVRAKGGTNRFKRLVSRVNMMRFLKEMNQRNKKWGVKVTPLAFYLLTHDIKEPRVIGVYRDPFAALYSNMKIFRNAEPFSVLIKCWEQANKDLIYHITTRGGILIKYDDLLDPEKTDRILENIVKFVGGGDVNSLKKKISGSLNRSTKEIKELREYYPLDTETQKVYESLERLKVS